MSGNAAAKTRAMSGDAKSAPNSAVAEVVRRYWGFDTLRPLQQDAIDAALAGRDSLVVMPTGGGKSLCYQVPPAVSGGTDIVVSPLISLMRDQVDGLAEVGYPAAALYTGLEPSRRREIEKNLPLGKYRLLFVAPERAITPWFLETAKKLGVRRIAIDEAHCISHWGHDFRPEYRQLVLLRRNLPETSIHAFTATATPRVRADIVQQMGLHDPALLVGSFDRPNLVYRVIPSVDVYAQTIDVVRRHADEAVIIYCISRKDTESTAAVLKANGIEAAAYHAGLDNTVRHAVQDAFSAEKLNVVVATVAFGMGIDRSNVRCVLHTAMPKTIEHYQQESGRAGRDSLAAECVLLYSFGDAMRWESLVRRSAQEADDPQQVIDSQMYLLKEMQKLCSSPKCRHRSLVEYFGQEYDRDNCGACDVCLSDVEGLEDGTVAAQKILSCVARVEENFGVGHVVDVLTGADTETVRRLKHNELTTYGLMRELAKKQVQSLVYQLVDQGLLDRTPGDRPILKLNAKSWQVIRSKLDVQLLRPKEVAPRQAKVDAESWEGVDRGLFDSLRLWRTGVARERNVPPYLVLDDAALRSVARIRPTKPETLRQVRGIGEKRFKDFGEPILELVAAFCRQHSVKTDQNGPVAPAEESALSAGYVKPKSANAVKLEAFAMFRKGKSIDDVKHILKRARSTVAGYLVDFIVEEQPAHISTWVANDVYKQVVDAASELGERRLSPIFEKLNARVSYDEIKLVLAHLEATSS
jgi:ATP-dependent DNA helicase RecQ